MKVSRNPLKIRDNLQDFFAKKKIFPIVSSAWKFDDFQLEKCLPVQLQFRKLVGWDTEFSKQKKTKKHLYVNFYHIYYIKMIQFWPLFNQKGLVLLLYFFCSVIRVHLFWWTFMVFHLNFICLHSKKLS